MIDRFAFALGQRAASRRHETGQEQVEPPLPESSVEDWRRGYGGNGKPCPRKSTAAVTAAASAASVPSMSPTAKAAPTGFVPVVAATVKAKPLTLFELDE